MNGDPRPPALLRRALAWALRSEDSASALGDLEEGFRRRVSEGGRGAATRWYWREALHCLLRFGLSRILAAFSPGQGSGIARHLRFALRRLLRNPGFTIVVAATLALGIGANATIFSVVDAVLFRPLPVSEPDRLVQLYGSSERDAATGGAFQGFLPHSYPNFEDLRDAATSVSGMFAQSQWSVSVAVGDVAERVDGLYVSASFFDILGVRPILGRGFRLDEDRQPGADAVVVLQHGYWERRFGADPSVVGSSLTLNGRTMEIVGVAPPEFRGMSATLLPDLFVPVSMIVDVPPWGPLWTHRGMRFFGVGARMAPGRSLADARAEMDALATRLAETFPEANRNRGVQVLPLQEARAGANQWATLSRTAAVLMGMAGVMLLIACINVANLLLARALARRTELAVRSALGATRGHLVGQMLAETGLFFALGAALGLGGALVGLGALDGIRPPTFGGGTLAVSLDLRVLAFTAVVTLAAAILFGVGPAVRAAHGPASDGLRSGRSGASRGGRLVREGLVTGQVALSVVALAGAGVFARSLQATRAVDPGFEVTDLGMMSVDLAAQGHDAEEGRVFFTRMIEAASALPGVESAAVGDARPLTGAPVRRATRLDQDRSVASTGHMVRVEAVSAGYFRTLDIEVEQGRPITATDRAGAPRVAVVNRRLATLLWPDSEPVGQRLHLSLVDQEIEVVGVAATIRTVALSEEDQPVLYLPLEQDDPTSAVLFVRTRAGASLTEVRDAVQGLDPSMPIFDLTTGDGLVANALWTASATARLLGLFGLLGLFLAAVGIYGVVAHSVRERTREVGLRIALGAGRRRILTTVVGRVLAVVGVGAACGVIASTLALRSFASILFQVETADPTTLGTVAAALLAVAALAAYVSARRATGVDPMLVLRGD